MAANTTGAACATIMQLKSVVTALPGGVCICCVAHLKSVVEHYLQNITGSVIVYSEHGQTVR